MKKIMWLCNTPLPEIQTELGIRVCGEGWLQGISNHLRRREDIELHYVFPQGKSRRLFKRFIDNIFFWGFYSNAGNGYELSPDRQKIIDRIIRDIDPDIIHIFGTEFAHSLECLQLTTEGVPVIVSIQGMISELAKVYTAGIPMKDQIFDYFLSQNKDSLWNKKYQFYRRGENEKEVLKLATDIIGRTRWDKQRINVINSRSRYFYCSETMREPFYDGKWNIDKVQRYSIYISQAYYPIKGLHIFIKAFHRVLQKYPQAVAYVAGDKGFLQIEDAYGCYINRLLKRYNITNKIVFLGALSAEEVKEKMLRTHVMVMPSLLENSPNSIGEAMLLGMPIVAADVGGVSSLIRHGKEAILYPDHKAEFLAKGIEYAFENDDVIKRMSSREKERAKRLYDRKGNLKQLMNIYERIWEEHCNE